MVLLSCVTSAFIISISSVVSIQGAVTSPRVARAQLRTHDFLSPYNITGTVFFTETENGLRVHGSITGLEPGFYGFHIHQYANIVIGCDGTGPHLNPRANVHGGRDHAIRHVGDLGNVQFKIVNGQSVASIDFEDSLISFRGQNNIVGRTLVLHGQEDDLGLTDHIESSISGNSGPRVACGMILVAQGDWDSNTGLTTYSSSTLIIFGVMILYLK